MILTGRLKKACNLVSGEKSIKKGKDVIFILFMFLLSRNIFLKEIFKLLFSKDCLDHNEDEIIFYLFRQARQ